MSSSSYFGLSLPERLAKSNSNSAFSLALQQQDTPAMLRILLSVDYANDAANATIKTLLNDPSALKN